MKYISTEKAPAAIGPYSQAVLSGNMLFCSGQIPINPVTGELVNSEIKEATEQVILNLKAVIEEAGMTLKNVVKTTVFITDMNNFKSMNEVYEKYFSETKPARACVQVSGLPRGVIVEIDAICVMSDE